MGCMNSKTSYKSQPHSQIKAQNQILFNTQDESPYVIKKNPIFQRRASSKSIVSPLQTASYIHRNK